jgi:hypothetical protein
MEAFKWEQKHTPKPAPPPEEPKVVVPSPRPPRTDEADRQLGELAKLVHREAMRASNITEAPGVNETETKIRDAQETSRRDSSESIYAAMNRRLNNLEGNSSLIARYIEEQSRVMRVALASMERDWDDWRSGRDAEEQSRWNQEVRSLPHVLWLKAAYAPRGSSRADHLTRRAATS